MISYFRPHIFLPALTHLNSVKFSFAHELVWNLLPYSSHLLKGMYFTNMTAVQIYYLHPEP